MASAWCRVPDPTQVGDSGAAVKVTWVVEASHHCCALVIG
jgi:hypothetical protein